MTAVRVLLYDLPRLLHDATAALLSGEPDIEVISDGGADPVVAAAASGSRLVVLGCQAGAPPAAFLELVRDGAPVSALAIMADGRRTSLYVPLGELTREGLLTAIRKVVE